MANTITAFTPELWTPTQQLTFLKENVAIALMDTKYEEVLYEGDKIHKPYGSYPRVQTYTKGTDISVKDISATDDSITVDTTKVASFYVDDIDRIQNKYDAIQENATIAGRQLSNGIDQASVNTMYSNAGTTLTDADLGGSSTAGIALSSSNVSSIFTVSNRALLSLLRNDPNKFALIGPRTLETLQNSISNRETTFGDTVGMNGKVGDRFGFDLRISNNLKYSASLVTSANIADTETIVINGVTFTADANGAAVGAGHFSIGANNDAAVANLILAINGTGTPAVGTYIDLSAEDRQKLEAFDITAVDGGSADSIDITGYGDIVVSETMDEAANVWGSQTQYLMMGIKKAGTLIVQKYPNVEFRDAQLRLGKYVHPWTLFGQGVWTRNKDSLVAVKIDASNWV
jgi:hypothetical protein